MSDRLTIDVETEALLAAFDALPGAVLQHIKPAAKVTADNIAAEARRRVARRTGETAEGIHVEETTNGDGYVVLPSFTRNEIVLHRSRRSGRTHTQRVTKTNLALWLEVGTKRMTARPYFFVSADLERGAHDRRMRDAVQAAIDEKGLGDA